jgi:thioredoxin reductase (NADPH)
VCDGALPIFRNQVLAVVGGGDSAIEEGSYLTKFASKVYLIHRRDELRASKAMQERFFRLVKEGKMEPLWNSEVTGILGDQSVTGARVRDTRSGAERDLPLRGIFMAIGHTPNSQLFRDYLASDNKGYIVLTDPPSTRTDVEGVFVAGDVADHVYRQAVTAAGTGCQAALDAERWLAAQGTE